MEDQKIINLLDNIPNQPSDFKTKNWVEINNGSYGVVYSIGSQIKFKTSLLWSSLCDYSDVFILVKETITVENTGTGVATTPFNECISEIDHTKNIDAVMQKYNLIEYTDNHSQTSGSLWQY